MSRNDDKIEEIQEYIRNKEADERAWERLIKPMKWICRTGAAALFYAISTVAQFTYHHFPQIKAAVDAFNKTSSGGQ